MVQVDHQQAERVGLVLKEFKPGNDFLRREFLSFDADRETKLRIYLLSVAICHQTRHLHHPVKNIWGWEHLEYGFLKMFREGNPLLNPGYLCICNDLDISSLLKAAFSPDGKEENSTLDRIDERLKMLQEICRVVKSRYKARISALIDQSRGLLINNGCGLYEVLPHFTAFSDPQKKKTSFFLKLASEAGLLSIRDPENCIPIMDYHMQRVLLRTGCVEVTDDTLRQKLIKSERMVSDEPVRSACIDAVKIIAQFSGHAIFAMNDFLWPLGRSCCSTTLLCQTGKCAKSPCTLSTVLGLENHDTCILEDVCKGRTVESYRSLFEPVMDTHFY
ncbi:MAG: hypothetical protein ACNA7V_04940 [Bacteroidales bacterium]